jgi:hypothetical protein
MKPVMLKFHILYKSPLTRKIFFHYLNCFFNYKFFLNRALPVLYTVNSGSINIDAPLISGVQVESGISVSKNSTFSASFYLVDALSKLAIPNPSWDVRIY